MIVCFFGEVVESGIKNFLVKDLVSGHILECTLKIQQQKNTEEVSSDINKELEVGEQGFFFGAQTVNPSNVIQIYRYDLRKLLRPMYENTIMDSAAAICIVELEDDPFPEIFKQFYEQLYFPEEELDSLEEKIELKEKSTEEEENELEI